MLNVPEAVKALFKTDGIAKNFRVHFPNAEYRDLTNSDIVAGSVKFTESVCSKEVLQFGLAEASRIEFECVGVPNIYGATIECFCEVDTSSLSSEYQTVKADVSYPVYAVPYGSFRVQSCPRNAGAMTHRRVEAYAEDNYSNLSQVLQIKLSLGSSESTRKQNPFLLVAQEINSIENLDVTETTVTGSDERSWDRTGTTQPTYTTWSDGEDTYTVHLIAGSARGLLVYNTSDSLYRFTADVDTTAYESVKAKLESYNASDYSIRKVRDRCLPGYHTSPMTVGFLSTNGGAFENPEDSGYIYPSYDAGGSGSSYIIYFTSLYGIIKKNGTQVDQFGIGNNVTNPVFTEYSLNDSGQALTRIQLKGGQVSSVLYSFIDSLETRSLVESTAELSAEFLQCSRDGGTKSINLSKSSPITISKSEHSDFWFDEYSISPIGSIKYTYYDIDRKSEATVLYEFGGGLSTYDMTDNYLLKHLAVSASDLTDQTVEEYVQSLFNTYFIPNISDISFIPVDLDMIGLPYIEAGDYIEVVAEDNTVVGTYVLSRSLSGEQYLTDAVESKGGEIIGSSVRSA